MPLCYDAQPGLEPVTCKLQVRCPINSATVSSYVCIVKSKLVHFYETSYLSMHVYIQGGPKNELYLEVCNSRMC